MFTPMSDSVNVGHTDTFDRRVQDGSLARQPLVVPWGPIIEALDGALLAPVYTRQSRTNAIIALR